MLPRATPAIRKSRHPAPLIRPWGRVRVFQEPSTTPTVMKMLRATRMIRRIGTRSARTAVLGRLGVLVASSPLGRVWVIATPGTGRRTPLDAAEHRVGADRQVGLPARSLQVGPGEADLAGLPPDLDPVGVALGHGQREGEDAVVIRAAQKPLAQGPALQGRAAQDGR